MAQPAHLRSGEGPRFQGGDPQPFMRRSPRLELTLAVMILGESLFGSHGPHIPADFFGQLEDRRLGVERIQCAAGLGTTTR